MIAILALFAAQAAQAQDDLARGAQIFAQSCAVGYCHGTAGAANRGPRLAGRGFDRAFVEKVVRDGVPGTAMPGFKALPAADLNAVLAYVMNISGGGAGPAVPIFVPSAEPPKFAGPPDAARGKDLFFDPIRGTRCGTCHAVEDWGAAVGPNLSARPPANAAAIRAAKASSVQTAVTGTDERFPALLVEKKPDAVRVYDLTVPPPVLRTFTLDGVRLSPGSTWSHSQAIQSYSEEELVSIVAYLRWLSSAQR